MMGEFRSVEKLLKILFIGEKEGTVSFKIEESERLKFCHKDTKEIILTQKMINKTEKNVYAEFKKENETQEDYSFSFLNSYEYPKNKRNNYSRAFKVDYSKEIIYVYSKEVFEVITNYLYCGDKIKTLFPVFHFLSDEEKKREYFHRIKKEIDLDWNNKKWDFLRNKTKTKTKDFSLYCKRGNTFYQIKGTFCSETNRDFFSVSLTNKKETDRIIKEVLDFNETLYRIFKECSVEKDTDFINKYNVDISCGSIGFKNFHVSTINGTKE